MDAPTPAANVAAAELLSVRGLKVEFATEAGIVPAVDGVSFDLHAG